MSNNAAIKHSATGERVVVAMSGGVDSSVAALLLTQAGYETVGISMQVWDYRQHGGCDSRRSCCAPDDFNDARKVAAKLEIPYYVFDFEQTFRREVIEHFVQSYAQGLTPNPCVECNNKVKFRELRDRAFAFGCRAVATGHYARVSASPRGPRLMRPKDKEKDQTYFLYGIKPEELDSTIFPLAELEKREVRELARAHGFSTADKAESQDICFVSGEVSDFVARVGTKGAPGQLLRRTGEVLGRHSGIHNFTVGQRRGLNLGGNEDPLYVIEIDAASHSVYVGGRQELEREGFVLHSTNWVSPEILSKLEAAVFPVEFDGIAQLRHRHQGIRVKVKLISFERAEITFVNDWSVVSPGQTGVIYCTANHELLGGGTIALS